MTLFICFIAERKVKVMEEIKKIVLKAELRLKKLFQQRQGFTLIEMMIVVAVIAVLTAIAVPKFNESLAMANTARVQADLQSLDTAIAMYRVNEGKAPQSLADLSEYIDTDNLKAPGGDVYIGGVLTSNENGDTYILSDDKTNATFMGKVRTEFGRESKASA